MCKNTQRNFLQVLPSREPQRIKWPEARAACETKSFAAAVLLGTEGRVWFHSAELP